MESRVGQKILSMDDLLRVVEQLKGQGKIVVQSHGVFDLIHPGIVKHLSEAKDCGDVLIVTVIRDEDVKRGPGRPIFRDALRAENVGSLEQVDYVCTVKDENPFDCVRALKPHLFARGRVYKRRDSRIYEEIFKNRPEEFFGECRIVETNGFSFSSSRIINESLDIYPRGTRRFIQDFRSRNSFKDISEGIHSLSGLKVLLIGDGIIDEYHYCTAMGKSGKAQLVVNRFVGSEVFAGGAFAIANHVAGICKEVTLVTLLGREDSREDFICESLRENVRTKFFYREDGPTVTKKRYLEEYNSQKLFEVNYLKDGFISADCESEIVDYLIPEIPNFDLVFASDFGHGLITRKIIRVLEKHSRKLAVNTQTNAANTGFNMVTRYKGPNFVCLDETEARLTMQDKYGDITHVAKSLLKVLGAECLIVTLGKRGALGVNDRGEVQLTPVFSTKVVDTVGAGDAFFSFTAPCFTKGMPLEAVTFIGNAVGAIAVQIVCNKRPVEKHELLEFIHTLLNRG